MRSHLLALGLWHARQSQFPNDSPCYAALLAILAHHGQLHKNAFREENSNNYWQIVTLPVDYINSHFDYFRQLEPDFQLRSWQLEDLSVWQSLSGSR